MSVPVALLAYALVVMLLAPRLLVDRPWVRQRPRLGVLAWQASVLSTLSALALLAFAAVLPVERVSFDVGHIIHACTEVLRQRYTVGGADLPHLAGAVVAAATLLALAWATLTQGRAVRRGRQRQRALVDLLRADEHGLRGVHVLQHEVPTAYCIPGDGGRVVLTTGTLSHLSTAQVQAVLAHERGHLQGRHDLVLFGADVASSAFPWSRFFRTARAQMRTLVELLADDAACRTADRRELASALVCLGLHGHDPVPEQALGAVGDTVVRVERLVHDPLPVRRLRDVMVFTSCVLLLAAPWVLAVAPAWAARTGRCPLPG